MKQIKCIKENLQHAELYIKINDKIFVFETVFTATENRESRGFETR
jgi:hypothetical protein